MPLHPALVAGRRRPARAASVFRAETPGGGFLAATEKLQTEAFGNASLGIPASLRRFARLECYDNVRAARLPALLRDENPGGRAWRLVAGAWLRENVGA